MLPSCRIARRRVIGVMSCRPVILGCYLTPWRRLATGISPDCSWLQLPPDLQRRRGERPHQYAGSLKGQNISHRCMTRQSLTTGPSTANHEVNGVWSGFYAPLLASREGSNATDDIVDVCSLRLRTPSVRRAVRALAAGAM